MTKKPPVPKATRVAEALRVIEALGGTFKVAELFEIHPASVSGWKKHGIPKARRQFLKLLRPDLFSKG